MPREEPRSDPVLEADLRRTFPLDYPAAEEDLFGEDVPPSQPDPPPPMPPLVVARPNLITNTRVEKTTEVSTQHDEPVVRVQAKGRGKRRKVTISKVIATHVSTVAVVESDTSDAY